MNESESSNEEFIERLNYNKIRNILKTQILNRKKWAEANNKSIFRNNEQMNEANKIKHVKYKIAYYNRKITKYRNLMKE